MTRFLTFLIALSSAPAFAQFPVPVAVEGGGIGDFITAVPNEFADIDGAGTFTFDGVPLAYTLTSADVGGVIPTDPGPPLVADFSNSDPVTFSTASGDLSMNYAGEVVLTPVTATTFTAVFIAEFVPIPASGTGVFEEVIGGQFEMTAVIVDPFTPKLDPSQTAFSLDIPYTWETTGGAGDFFTLVPEPTTAVLVGLGVCGLTLARRRK